MSWLLIPAVLCSLLALLSWAIIYSHYWRTPQRRWRQKVLKLATEARQRVQTERNFLRRLDASQERDKKSLRQETLRAFLGSISINELEACPGIGPGTIGKLSQAGYTNLASLQHADIQVQGLGRKRVTDIHNAVQELTKQARGRFEAGAGSESQTLKTSLDALRSKYDNLKFLPQARLKAAQTVVEMLEELIPLARKLRFLNYWRRNFNDLVPSDILGAELPDLEATIHRAEQKAEAILQLKASEILDSAGIALPGVVPVTRIEEASPAPPTLSKSPVKKKQHAVSSAVSAGTQVPSHSGLSPLAEKDDADIPLLIMELSIQFAFAVARARAPASASQKTVICDYFLRQYEDDPILFNRARAFCAHYEKSPIDTDAVFRRLNELLSTEQRSTLFELAAQVRRGSEALNDGDEFLATVAKKLRVHFKELSAGQTTTGSSRSDAVPQIDGARQLTNDQYRGILEIDATIPLSADLIRRHFNLLHQKYNPEKVADLGAEFVDMTKRKREEILLAAQTLIQQFGEKLELADAHSQPKALRENPDLDAVFGV